MTINPKILTAPNGRRYACFFDVGYAMQWARTQPGMARKMAVRIGHLAGFLI